MSAAGIRFATAGAEDADAMRELARRAYARYVGRIGREPAPMGADYAAIAASGTATLVREGDRLVAMMVTAVRPDSLEVTNLAVDPDRQGAGLGTVLLTYAEELARAGGLAALTLYTNEAMTENIEYYPRRGFVETGRRAEEGFRRVYFERPVL